MCLDIDKKLIIELVCKLWDEFIKTNYSVISTWLL
jgi:hypothetical protein